MLSPVLLDHFKHPRGAGRIEGATGQGLETNAACGDRLELFVRVESDSVAAAGFLAQGCSALIACASFVVDKAKGMRREDVAALDADALLAEVGETSAARRHGMQLAVRALKTALDASRGKPAPAP